MLDSCSGRDSRSTTIADFQLPIAVEQSIDFAADLIGNRQLAIGNRQSLKQVTALQRGVPRK